MSLNSLALGHVLDNVLGLEETEDPIWIALQTARIDQLAMLLLLTRAEIQKLKYRGTDENGKLVKKPSKLATSEVNTLFAVTAFHKWKRLTRGSFSYLDWLKVTEYKFHYFRLKDFLDYAHEYATFPDEILIGDDVRSGDCIEDDCGE
jgi:hypothetical protein